LGAGAIAGIVVGAIAIVAGSGLVAYIVLKKMARPLLKVAPAPIV
jgi:hypothetical protein